MTGQDVLEGYMIVRVLAADDPSGGIHRADVQAEDGERRLNWPNDVPAAEPGRRSGRLASSRRTISPDGAGQHARTTDI